MLLSFLYVEIDVFAALVLLVITDRSRFSLATLSQKLFRAEQASVVAVLLLDAATWAFNGAAFRGARVLCLVSNYLYWFVTLVPCAIGMLYCISVAFGRLSRSWHLAAVVPILAGAVLLCCNFRSGWIFTVSADNVYARGPYFLLVGALPFVHMALSVCFTLKKYLSSPAPGRKQYLMLCLFMLVPLLGSLFQIFFYGVVTIWISLTLSILMCYVYIQRGSLATDPLTGLNNRGRFDYYAAWLWDNLKGSSAYLMILDINRFKSINDTYGHAEGDSALIRAASVLRAVMASKKGFLARIGGDEFAILLRAPAVGEPAALADEIRRLMAEENRSSGAPYELSFSIGGAASLPGEAFRVLFARADDLMYREKSLRSRSAP